MSLSPSATRRLRWGVPAVVAGAVAAVAVLPGAATADPSPRLSARTAAQLLADLHTSDVAALSGTVVETARLGLPNLPQLTGGSTSPTSMLAGSTTLKVWYDGDQRQRVALLGRLAEYEAVHSGQDLWTYSSDKNTVTHVRLPAEAVGTARPGASALGVPSTPQAAAEQALAAVDPTTKVTVDRTARVAGRSAYQLVMTPRDAGSLVTSVRVALDSATKTPLRVQVWGSGDSTKPAFEVGFTDVSFSRPAPRVFAFSTPPGATVKEEQLPASPQSGHAQDPSADKAGAQPTVLGKGWASVVRVDGVNLSAASGTASSGGTNPTALLGQLTTRVPEGRSLQTALVSALLTDDGRLFVGSVPVSRLQQLAR